MKNSHWILGVGFLVWAICLFFSWQNTAFWPDADGYEAAILNGRWTAHPPGYFGYMVLSKALFSVVPHAHLAAQMACLLLTSGGFICLFRISRYWLEEVPAAWLSVSFLLSWLPLIISRTGTSHASDFLSVSLIVMTGLQCLRSPRNSAFIAFFASLWLAAFFRLTTFVFFLPLAGFLTLFYYRRVSWWLAGLGCALVVFLQQIWVIQLSGGWQAYHTYAAGMHAGNLTSSLIYSGVNRSTGLNIARTLFWGGFSILTPAFIAAFVFIKNRFSGFAWDREWILLVLCCILPFSAVALYLCTHIGYLAPALVPAFVLAARLLSQAKIKSSSSSFIVMLASSLITLVFFLTARPILTPRKPSEAALNTLLLQYSAQGLRDARWESLSKALHKMGNDDLVPGDRLKVIEKEHSR